MTAMVCQRDGVDLGMLVPNADERVLITCDWDSYETQLSLRGERSRPKLAYLDGVLEIMSPSPHHENIKSRIGMVIEAYLVCANKKGGPRGGPTLRRRLKEAGAEPDESYSFVKFDADNPATPDLVIEVNWTRGGIDKLEIYRRLEVREVWFWETDVISVHVLGPDGYAVRERSSLLPDLDLDLVLRLLEIDDVVDLHAAMREALTAR